MVIQSVAIALPVDLTYKNRPLIWMQKRLEDGPFKGFWEFPGGKIEPGETPLQACLREFSEEVEINPLPLIENNLMGLGFFNKFVYTYNDRKVELHAFLFQFFNTLSQIEMNNSHFKLKGQWFSFDEIGTVQFQSTVLLANHQIMNELKKHYGLDQ